MSDKKCCENCRECTMSRSFNTMIGGSFIDGNRMHRSMLTGVKTTYTYNCMKHKFIISNPSKYICDDWDGNCNKKPASFREIEE